MKLTLGRLLLDKPGDGPQAPSSLTPRRLSSRRPAVLELPSSGMSLGSCSLLAYPLRLSTLIHLTSTPLSWASRNHNVDHRPSSKLFADVEHEQRVDRVEAAPPRAVNLQAMVSEHPNWEGDESIEDAVLRMLVDKYKPLRTGTIHTAEEKIRRSPPQVTVHQPEISPTGMSISENPSVISSSSHSRVYRADEPLLPAVEGHKPWLTTFKVPSHATASIRYGHFPVVDSPSYSETSMRNAAQTGPADADRARRKERDVKKRSEIEGRLTRAKESSLDYRLGIARSVKSGVQARPNPMSIKGWAGLVEERIEVRCKSVAFYQFLESRTNPISLCSEHDCKDTSARSRAAGSPSRGVTKSTTHSLPVRNSS